MLYGRRVSTLAKKAWTPLDLNELPPMKLIACDPSLTACGVVYMSIEDSGVVVYGAEKLGTVPTDRKGWDDTFYRADLIEALLDSLMDDWLPAFGKDCVSLHEAPPVGNGTFRSESTILTGKAFRTVMNEYNITILDLATPHAHKYLTCGNGRAKKTEHHEAIKRLLPYIINSSIIKNEAHRDALSIGLYAAWREGQRQKSGNREG